MIARLRTGGASVRIRRGPALLAVALIVALSAASGGPAGAPASASAPVLPGQPVQHPSGVPYAVTATPVNEVVDGQAVKVNVQSNPDYPVYDIRIQLCRRGVTYLPSGYQSLPPDFREGGANCPAKQISSNGDHLVVDSPQAVGNAMLPGGETVTFHAGAGSTSWTSEDDGSTQVLTCDVSAPCALVVEVLAGVDAGTRWDPWVFDVSYRDANPLNSCGGPAAGILRASGPDHIQDAYINWTVALCKKPGQAGAASTTSFAGEGDALAAFSEGTVDLAYTSLGYSNAANLVPPDFTKPNGGHRPSIAIPVAINAAVVAVGNGEIAQGKKVPYESVSLTTNEAASLFAQGQAGVTPYIGDIQARNPAMLTVVSQAFGRMPAVSAKSEGTSWLATRYFARLAPAQWVVGGLGDLRPLWGQARSVDPSFALANPTFAGVLATLSELRGSVRKTTVSQTLDDTGGAWVLTDLATARALDLTPVQLTNATGEFVGATSSSMEAAVAAMSPNEAGVLLPDTTMAASAGVTPYPLTFVEYAVVPAEPLLELDCTPRSQSQQHLKDWLTYITGEGQQHLPAGMVPLPAALVEEAKTKIEGVGASSSTRQCPPPPPEVPAPATFEDPGASPFTDASSTFDSASTSFSESASAGATSSSFAGPTGVPLGSSAASQAGAPSAGSKAPPPSVELASVPTFAGNTSANGWLAVLAFLLIAAVISGAVLVSAGRPRSGASGGTA